MWGVGKVVIASPDPGAEYEKWAEEYGGVYEVASALGGRKIVLCDPKAVAHFYGREPWTYTLTPFGEIATENVVSRDSSKSMMIVRYAYRGCTGWQGNIVRKGRKPP